MQFIDVAEFDSITIRSKRVSKRYRSARKEDESVMHSAGVLHYCNSEYQDRKSGNSSEGKSEYILVGNEILVAICLQYKTITSIPSHSISLSFLSIFFSSPFSFLFFCFSFLLLWFYFWVSTLRILRLPTNLGD